MLRIWILIITMASCKPQSGKGIDLQGHRGARGLAPENSIPGFILATDLGVKTLELDLVVSKDGQLVVSHEPYFSPSFCTDSLGNLIHPDSIINIYKLDYDQIRKFDCGSIGNDRFPEQERIETFKPLLKDVVDSVESYISKNGLTPIRYNIELKTQQETDRTFHPVPSEFSDMVYAFLLAEGIIDRVTIQSFDFRTLIYFNKKYPEVELAILIENNSPWKTNIDSLGFTPEVYSCYYELLSQENVKEIQNAGMKIIPWTVNEVSDIRKVIDLGVDGLITDYPDRALKVIQE
ncbi:glycerophosphodiester phosphodiesterase family protein [Ekhidna sp.]|uniref:glycerophosphodiester phosphodiesterase family protein n=1 Tax=Ekhidna sp. TaxID=2608089 RepID=UPI00329715DE